MDGEARTGTYLGEAVYGGLRTDVGLTYSDTRFNNSGFSLNWNTNNLTKGNHTIYVYARSARNNNWFFLSRTVNVIPDAISPTSPIISELSCNASTNIWQRLCNDPNFAWSGAIDTGSGVAGYEYKWGSNTPVWTTGTDYDAPAVGEGSTTFQVRAKDYAGNWSGWSTFVLKYDATTPSGSLTVNNDASSSYTTLVKLNTQASDTVSGVKEMRVCNLPADYSAWMSYAPSIYWTLPAVSGQDHIVQVEYKDWAGNISPAYSKTVHLTINPARPSSATYHLDKSVWGASSAQSAGIQSSNFKLKGTMGQSTDTGRMGSSLYQIWSGFWAQIFKNPTPTLTGISPSSITAGSGDFLLTVTGSNFLNGSAIRWNGTPLTTTWISSTQLSANISASRIVAAGSASVTVFSPGPGGGVSSAQTFTINNPSPNPVPALSNLSPSWVEAGSGDFLLTVTGWNFVNASVIRWNGTLLTTTWISSTELRATVSASKVAAAGSASVTVLSPAPGGGETAALTFMIMNPVPVLTSLSPSWAEAGSGSFVLTVTGSRFVNGSVIRWNASNLTTTWISSTQLSASIAASKVATAGTADVTVLSPEPGGGETSQLPFTITTPSTNPIPTLTNLSPSWVEAGSGDFLLTVTGSNFVNGSLIRWNDGALATTWISDTQLSANISASKVAAPGTASVTVFSPTPGGGVSSPQTFTITAPSSNPTPLLTSLSPSSVIAGGGSFVLTVTGVNFTSESVIRWDGADMNTLYIDNNHLSITLGASYTTTSGTHLVSVFTPAPGGGKSSDLTFTVLPNNGNSHRVYLPAILK